MRGLIKHIVSATYKPLLVKYLATTRTYSYKGIHLEIPPQVFHPGFFFSTKLLLRYISKEHLSYKTFLELGAGSGLLSIYAAKRGASVVATDINPISIECINLNAEENAVEVKTILSDVFDNVSPQNFDYILINPPYYRKKPSSFPTKGWRLRTTRLVAGAHPLAPGSPRRTDRFLASDNFPARNIVKIAGQD